VAIIIVAQAVKICYIVKSVDIKNTVACRNFFLGMKIATRPYKLPTSGIIEATALTEEQILSLQHEMGYFFIQQYAITQHS
jgi:hypothetical protein